MASEQAYFKDLQNLRSERLSLFNRTRSIAKDSAFVSDVKASYGDLPLVANLRCGLWYSNSFDDHAYFKSTDGHSHMCDLNMRRLNLHLLKHLQTSGGFMLVDSSRRKRFPDSMSRTVPIWAACVNAVVDRYQHRQRQDMHKQFPEAKVDPETQLPFNLYVLPTMVSAMEKAQLESMMEQWLVKLERTLTESTLDDMSAQMGSKRLRPLWVSPQSALPDNYPEADELGFWPLLLVSASVSVGIDGLLRSDGFTYIQGAADDEEDWAGGLTADLFWKHYEAIMACRHEGELSALLARMHHPPAATPVSNQTTTTAAEKPGQRLTSATTRQPIAIGRTGMYVCDASTLSGSVQVHSVSGTEPASVECCWNGVRERNTVDAGMGGQVETGQGLSSAPGHGRKGLPGCGCTAESIYSYDAVVEFYVGQSATEVWAAGEAGEAIDKLTISDDPTPVGRGATVDTAAGRAALTGTSPPHPNTVRVRLVEAKADVQTLEQFLRGSAMWFVRDALRRGGKVLISCPSGSGPSVMLVLCVLCAYYHEGYTAIRHTCDGDEDGEGEGRQQPVTKVDVNQALIYIERFHPEVARLKKMYLKIANRCLMSASR